MKSALRVISVAALLVAVVACSSGGGNPLLEEEWNTAFGVPPFDRIENEHYLPAFREAMARHSAEIEAIIADPAEPTFENTIVALDRSGRLYTRVASVFGAVQSAHSNEVIEETATILAPERAAHADDINLNQDLYERVRAVYEQRDALDLTPEQRRLLEETHKGFVRSGVSLEAEARARLREINGEIAELSQAFGQNLLADTNAFELHVIDRADLGDLPASLVAAAVDEARRREHDEGWSFTLQRPSCNPFLQYSPNREFRRRVYEGYVMRGDNDNENDNKQILARIAALRAERAALMGYETHAHFILSDNMARTPANVYGFLDQIWRPALRVAVQERQALQQIMHTDGIAGELEGWDWRYYAEKVRQERYALNEEEIRPYFRVEAVRDGVFELATRLWGLQFTELPDLPRWHPDQKVFEVTEADGSHLGVLYMDFYARESKRGGAWMNDLRAQSKVDGEVKAVVTTNFNFPAPSGDTPSLISFDDALTLAHEFGHALHGLFSDVTYESLSGTAVPRDFVEFPSQIMENWMSEPEVIRSFARHYETGEPIPEDLLEKILAAGQFGQGFATVEYLAASYLDLAWHTLSDAQEKDARAFERAEMDRIGLIGQIPPRYRSGYFQHIFSGGYSAGYYAYIWAEVLDADAFQAFKETDLFNREVAARLRAEVLSRGGTRPGMEMYRAFRGRDPGIEALLAKRGLTGGN